MSEDATVRRAADGYSATPASDWLEAIDRHDAEVKRLHDEGYLVFGVDPLDA